MVDLSSPLLIGPGDGQPAARVRNVPWFPLVFLAAIPAFTALTDLKIFRRSLTSATFSSGGGGGGGLAVYCAALAALSLAALSLLAWHVYYGWKHCGGNRQLLLGYLLPRLLTFAFFTTYLLVLVPSLETGRGAGGTTAGDTNGGYHLHHWWIAWLLSLLFSFNNPISALSLAISTAAFTQGCAAYNVAPIIVEDSCAWFEGATDMSLQLNLSNQLVHCAAAPSHHQHHRDTLLSFDICMRHGGKLECLGDFEGAG